jgi:uncharacterized membrane protein YtjA (UPF0391 family)
LAGTDARPPGYRSIPRAGVLRMTLLKWALICFVISLIAGGLGFTGIASGAGSLARILFGLFLVVAIIIVVVAVAIGQAVF